MGAQIYELCFGPSTDTLTTKIRVEGGKAFIGFPHMTDEWVVIEDAEFEIEIASLNGLGAFKLLAKQAKP